MAIKGLVKIHEKRVQDFINQGQSAPEKKEKIDESLWHRVTLRLSPELLTRLDEKRKNKIGSYSRNQAIIEAIEKFVRE